MKTKITLLLIVFALFVNAQDGILDTTFGTNGKIDYSIFTSFVDMQFDYVNNKIVALGKGGTNNYPIIVRYNLNGTLDTTFGGTGIVEVPFGQTNDTPTSLCIYDYDNQSFGYLITSSKSGAIAKINSSGNNFSSFGIGGKLYYNSYTYDGHIAKVNYDYVTGNIVLVVDDSEFSSSNMKLYRFTINGSTDTTFNNGNYVSFNPLSGYTIAPNSISTDDQSNIYISAPHPLGGGFDTYTKKFTSTGALDSSYNSTFGSTASRSFSYPGHIHDVADNTSYIFGMNQNYKMFIAKKNAFGTADNSFGTSGISIIDFTDTYYDNVKSVTGHGFESSFKIILAGRTAPQYSSSGTSNISLTRIFDNGTLDTSFGTNGKTSVLINYYNYSSNLPSFVDFDNGKLYVMGYTNTSTVSLYRFNLGSILSTNNFSNNHKTTFSPNPATSTITFAEEISNLEVFDITSKKVKSFGSAAATFNVEDLEKGIYILKGKTTEGNFINEKLIKN